MDTVQWIVDASQAIRTTFLSCCWNVSVLAEDSWTWLLQPQQKDRRIYFILKCIVYGTVGIALTLYLGFKALGQGQRGLELSAKQICNGGNLTAKDQRWCNDPANNPPLSSIMDSVASHVLAVHDWLYYQLAAFGFCGPWIVNERSGETCIGLGLILAMYLLTPTSLVGKYVKPERMSDFAMQLASLTALLGNYQAVWFLLARMAFTALPGYWMYSLQKKDHLSSLDLCIIRGLERFGRYTGLDNDPLPISSMMSLKHIRCTSPKACTMLDEMLSVMSRRINEDIESRGANTLSMERTVNDSYEFMFRMRE